MKKLPDSGPGKDSLRKDGDSRQAWGTDASIHLGCPGSSPLGFVPSVSCQMGLCQAGHIGQKGRVGTPRE